MLRGSPSQPASQPPHEADMRVDGGPLEDRTIASRPPHEADMRVGGGPLKDRTNQTHKFLG